MTQLCKDSGFGQLKGSNTLSFDKVAESDTILSTHVGTAVTRDEINIKRLLRYLVGNPVWNMTVGCNLDVLGIAGTPQVSVLVMTVAGWAGDVKDRRSYSGIVVWIKGSVGDTWYPVYASSKKQNMLC